MNITWQPKSLPSTGQMLGHGVCILAQVAPPGQPELVAFVIDFGWLHRGEDAIVRFDPQRLPVGPVRESVRAAVENLVRGRKRQMLGEIAPGISVYVNG